MGAFKIRFADDGYDQIGKLWFDVETGRFSGSGFFWSDLTEIPGLIAELRAFPLRDRIFENWGYNEGNGQDAILSLIVEPAGPAGGIVVSVIVGDL